MTVLYTTHYMEEAQELSDHIAILDHGKLIASGTHAELVKLVGEMDRVRLSFHPQLEPDLAAWKAIPGIVSITNEDGALSILTPDSNQLLPALFEIAISRGVRITSVEIHEPNLESVFLHLTGRALRD